MDAIYLSFDDRFFPQARACLNSLTANWPEHPQVLVDYRGVNADALAFLTSHSVTVLAPAEPLEFVQHLRPIGGWTAVFNRFRLWTRAFQDFDTILHLDADTLVLQPADALLSEPTPFFVSNHEPFDDVQLFSPRFSGDPVLHAMLDHDGLRYPDGPDAMANAGVFTLPRDFRQTRELARLARLARRYGPFCEYADQSILSLWLMCLDLRPSFAFEYNFQTPFFTDPSAALPLEDIRILHFSGHRKPGTEAFNLWNRVGSERDRLIALYTRYRDAEP